MGSAGFADRVKKKFFSKKRHKEVAESKLLAPDVSVVRDMVCRSYGVKEEDLPASRRGRPNEARNIAIYLLRQLRGSKLKKIGTEFGISSYSTVSTIIERTRNEIPRNRRLRKRIEQLGSELVLSQDPIAHCKLAPMLSAIS